MSEHNSDVNEDCKTRKTPKDPKSKVARFLQDGFSLVEVVVAVGIGSIVSAGVAAVFVFAVEQFTILVEQNAAEESLLWSAYNTRAFLGQAVDIKVKRPPLSLTMTPADDGQIISQYNSSANIGVTSAVAIFGRESTLGMAASTSMTSDIFASGVFITSPSLNPTGSNSTPMGGSLYFDGGVSGSSGATTLSASQRDVWYDRLSEFRIEDVECVTATGTGREPTDNCDGLAAKSATVVIKTRYFKTARRNLWIWQQQAVIPGGTTVGPYRDIEMSIKVGFRNNLLLGDTGGPQSRVGMGGQERLHGGLYFFRMVLPPVNVR